MTTIQALFLQHWAATATEPPTEEHFQDFLALRHEYPMQSVAELVTYTVQDSLLASLRDGSNS